MRRFAWMLCALAGLSLVVLPSCSIDDGRPLAEYEADRTQIQAGQIPAKWKSVAIKDAGPTDTSGGKSDTKVSDAKPTDTGGAKDAGATGKDTGSKKDTAKPVDTGPVDTGPVDTGPPPKDGCSGPDGAKYNITITNTTNDRNLTIAWNDIDCKEKVLGKIKPGKSANLLTRLNRWVVIKIDPNDNIIRSFRVKKTTSPAMMVP